MKPAKRALPEKSNFSFPHACPQKAKTPPDLHTLKTWRNFFGRKQSHSKRRMCYEVWSNVQTLGVFVPSGCSSTHIKTFTTVSTCSNRFLKSDFILYVEKKKDYLGGLQESAEKDSGETLYSSFKSFLLKMKCKLNNKDTRCTNLSALAGVILFRYVSYSTWNNLQISLIKAG